MVGGYYLRKLPDPILRQPCVEVNDFSDLSDLLSNMRQIMSVKKGISLSAPQIGDNRRVAIAQIDGEMGQRHVGQRLQRKQWRIQISPWACK